MKRRTFLGAAFAATAVLPLCARSVNADARSGVIPFSAPAIQTPNRPILGEPAIRLIGVSDAGSHLVSRYWEDNALADWKVTSGAAINDGSPAFDFLTMPSGPQSDDRDWIGLPTRPLAASCAKGAENPAWMASSLRGTGTAVVVAGLGGRTGSLWAPRWVRSARAQGAFTVAIVFLPASWERPRPLKAAACLDEIAREADSTIVIPLDGPCLTVAREITLRNYFRLADEMALSALRGILGSLRGTGLVLLDPPAVEGALRGRAITGHGLSSGRFRACNACSQAIHSPTMAALGQDSRRILFHVAYQDALEFGEVRETFLALRERYPDAEIIGSATKEPGLGDAVRTTLIASVPGEVWLSLINPVRV